MRERVLVALIGIPLVLAAVCAPRQHVFLPLLIVAGAICFQESYFLRQARPPIQIPPVMFGGLATLLLSAPVLTYGVPFVSAYAILFALFAIAAASWPKSPHSLWPVLGLVPLAALQPLPMREQFGPSYVLMAMIPLWVGDSAAYFVGKAFGKHKLAPNISPNKTWEGAIANLLGCLLGAWMVGEWLKIPLGVSLLCGTVSGILGQAGDLFESSLKRRAGVKDSGNLLPGHGGLLDRLDSLIATAPFVTLILLLAR